MLTKEEAHWASFRSAVLGPQQTLIDQSPAPATSDTLESSSSSHVGKLPEPKEGLAFMEVEGDAQHSLSHSTPQKETPQSALDVTTDNIMAQDGYEENTKPQSADSWDTNPNNIDTEDQTHQHLELIGLEEVKRNIDLRNATNAGGNDLLSPARAPSHASHTSNALSMAEQELVDTKLKLAMTESERDELEFQLMQSDG